MSETGGLKEAGMVLHGTTWPSAVMTNVMRWFSLLWKHSRIPNRTRPTWRSTGRLLVGGLLATAAIMAVMFIFDGWISTSMRSLPPWCRAVFDEITEYGRNAWLLIPIVLMLFAIAALSPAFSKFTNLVAAALAVRLGFLFAAIAVPGLAASIIKRVIGRARPSVTDVPDPYLYQWFVWHAGYSSMPSGHATAVLAAVVAVGAVWPRLRVVMWVYALAVVASRVVIRAHYPSDVLAGALFGALGAMLVRDWCAARRLGFWIAPDGHVHAMPGPSLGRIKRVARGLIGQSSKSSLTT